MAATGYLLGITESREYAEPEWYVDIWLTIVWVAYLVLSWRKRQEQTGTAVQASPPANALRRPGEEPDDYMKRVERELRETE